MNHILQYSDCQMLSCVSHSVGTVADCSVLAPAASFLGQIQDECGACVCDCNFLYDTKKRGNQLQVKSRSRPRNMFLFFIADAEGPEGRCHRWPHQANVAQRLPSVTMHHQVLV